MDREQAGKALLGINLVIGIGFVLFPRQSMRLYGLDPKTEKAAAYLVRYLGARSLIFAAMLADADGRPALLKQMPVFAGADGVVNGLALMSGEVPRRVAVLGALTSALAVGLGFASDR